MPIISVQKLEGANLDAETIEEVVNGEPNTTVVTRKGRIVPTLATLREKHFSTGVIVEGNKTQQEINQENTLAISALSTNANKYYPTLAAATADIANIAVNAPVQIGEAANGGLWVKETAGATSLTKSTYDPITQARQEILPTKNKVEGYDTSLEKGYLANRILSINGTKPTGTNKVEINKDNIGFKSGQILIVKVTSSHVYGVWFNLRGYKADGSYVDVIPRQIITAKLDTTITLTEDFVSFRVISEETVDTTYTVTCDLFGSTPINQSDVINAVSQTDKNKAVIGTIDNSIRAGILANKFIDFSSSKDTSVASITIDRNNPTFANGDTIFVQFTFNNLNSWFTLRGYKADGSYDTLIPRFATTSVSQGVTLANTYTYFRVIYEYSTGTTIPVTGGIYANKPIKTTEVEKNATDITALKSSDAVLKDSLKNGYFANSIIDFSGVKASELTSLTVNKNNTNSQFKNGDVLIVRAVYENYELWFNLRGYKTDGSYDHIIARTALKSVNQSVTLTADYVSFRMIFDYAAGPAINVSASMSLSDPIKTSEIRTLQTDQAILLNSAKPFIGKKYFAVGDSITMNATDWNATQGGYIYSILQNTGMTFVGSTGASGNGMPLMLFARNMKTLAATIANADVLTVLGGTNDYHSLSAYTIGSFADEAVPYSQLETVSPMSIYQAVKTIIKCAQEIKPSIKIVFFTEPERGTYVNGGTNYPSTHTPPNASPNGLTMHGIAYAIKDCANRLGVSAFDTHADLWTFEQVASACPDMLHPSKNISTKMGELFSKRINSLVPIL